MIEKIVILSTVLSCSNCKGKMRPVYIVTIHGKVQGYKCPVCNIEPTDYVLENSDLKFSIGYVTAPAMRKDDSI